METERGRVPTTHNALIYREREGVVHGRRPAGYRDGGRPIFSALGRGGSARFDETTHRPGRAVPSAGTIRQQNNGNNGKLRIRPRPVGPSQPVAYPFYWMESP